VSAATIAPEITIDDFAKLDLRVGVVRSAETIADAKKLLRLQVDLGEGRLRQILAGIRAYYPDAAALVGKRVIVVANLKPRQMKWGVSEGMVLAAGGPAESGRPHRVASFDDEKDAPQPGDKIA
jgi:methionyl-tRNA synthetase